MSNEKKELALVQNSITEQVIKNYLFTSETRLSEKQQQMFMQMAIRHGLDPFKREIYAIAYGKEFQIVTGYQVYIERADASGKLNGWNCINTAKGAEITIFRKDWEQPFKWEASYDEFDKKHGSWLKMRQFMIKKVCIGQGFRLAFPTELGGLPYLQEELEGATPFENKPVQQPQSKTKAQPAKPEDELPVFHEPIKEQKFITNVHKITKKGLDFRILGDDDIIYVSRQETFAALAKSAKEAGLKISGTQRDFIIINLELVEPKEETQEEFLDGLEEDAVKEGFKELPY